METYKGYQLVSISTNANNINEITVMCTHPYGVIIASGASQADAIQKAKQAIDDYEQQVAKAAEISMDLWKQTLTYRLLADNDRQERIGNGH